MEGEAVALLQASGDGVAGECAEMGEDVCEVHDSWPAGVRLLLDLGAPDPTLGCRARAVVRSGAVRASAQLIGNRVA